MRVLLRDNESLRCLEVISASINAEDNELVLETQEEYVTVSDIAPINAEAAVRALFRDAMVDLSLYQTDI